MTHTILTTSGCELQIPEYARWKAIKLHCEECFGTNPLNCEHRTCALYPYRGKTSFLRGLGLPRPKTALPRPKKAVCLPTPPLPPLRPPKTAQNRPTVRRKAT